jgi:hypothetical protein
LYRVDHMKRDLKTHKEAVVYDVFGYEASIVENGKVIYSFKHESGVRFECEGATLEDCRKMRDQFLKERDLL